jgi:hypothetical protein
VSINGFDVTYLSHFRIMLRLNTRRLIKGVGYTNEFDPEYYSVQGDAARPGSWPEFFPPLVFPGREMASAPGSTGPAVGAVQDIGENPFNESLAQCRER